MIVFISAGIAGTSKRFSSWSLMLSFSSNVFKTEIGLRAPASGVMAALIEARASFSAGSLCPTT